MTKLSFGAHPFLLGFEQLERLVERTAKTASEGYPPFNIEATSDNTYRITLAVAGFREDDLAITVEDRQLVIRGRQGDDGSDRVFLHRGIAARAFQRSFVLAKQRGAYRGRKKSLNSEQIAELKRRVAAGDQKTLVARDFGISRETLYQYLRED